MLWSFHTLAMTVRNPACMAELVVVTAGIATFIAAVIWTTCIIVLYRRDKRRSKFGLCMRCGYDLSHSQGRCPECGETIRK